MTWTRIIEEYTPMDLTVPEDRLVALSGVAEVRHSLNKDQYVVGMWREDLKSQLLWQVWFKGPALKSYIAPSWSWASVTGTIRYPFLASTSTGKWKVLEVKCHPKVEGTFGDCKEGAHIVIQGPLIPVHLVETFEGWKIELESDRHSAKPKLTPQWDSDDRRDITIEQRSATKLVFFVVSRPFLPPQGLLLKSRGLQSEPIYERVAYISEPSTTRRRTWSDESSVSGDDGGNDDSRTQFKSWYTPRKQQVFSVY
jgi:hypothetical protein